MRNSAFIAILLILLVIVATAVKIWGAEKILYQNRSFVGGLSIEPESLWVKVYGDWVLVDSTKDTLTTGDTLYNDSITGDFANYDNLYYQIMVYADSYNCAPCYNEALWIRGSAMDFTLGPAAGDSTTMVWAIIEDQIGNPISGVVMVAKTAGTNVEDTCAGTILGQYEITSEKSGSDGVVELELKWSSCLAGDDRWEITFKKGRKPIKGYNWTGSVPSDVDSFKITGY